MKWLCWLFQESNTLWRSLIQDKYTYLNTIGDIISPTSGGRWKNHCNVILNHLFNSNTLLTNYCKRVVNGLDSYFGHELRTEPSPSIFLFPFNLLCIEFGNSLHGLIEWKWFSYVDPLKNAGDFSIKSNFFDLANSSTPLSHWSHQRSSTQSGSTSYWDIYLDGITW